MAPRLILDTGVLIGAERGRIDLAAIADDEADAALPAIVVAEYLTGVRVANTDEQRAGRQAFLDRVLSALPVLDYTRLIAEHHATLLAHTRRAGTGRGAHDLIVAATAAATGRTIVTTDHQACFHELPDVAAIVV